MALRCLADDVRRGTQLHIGANGQVSYSRYTPDVPLAAQLPDAREILLANADTARLGFVALLPGWAYGWGARGRAWPPLPSLPNERETYAFRCSSTLWRCYVPDAHVMQILTAEHMARMSDLSAWTVTAVGGDRYLVEAPAPEEWVRPRGPSAAMVARARADFGDAVIPAGTVS